MKIVQLFKNILAGQWWWNRYRNGKHCECHEKRKTGNCCVSGKKRGKNNR